MASSRERVVCLHCKDEKKKIFNESKISAKKENFSRMSPRSSVIKISTRSLPLKKSETFSEFVVKLKLFCR